jgi:hypothetical protein
VNVVELARPSADNIIATLEALLEEARAGSIAALAYAIARPNGGLATNVVWEAGRAAPLLVAGTAFLHRRAMDEVLDAQE